jgi:hypothetical protein
MSQQESLRSNARGEHFDARVLRGHRAGDSDWLLQVRMKIFLRPIDLRTGPAIGYYQEEDDRFGLDQYERMPWEAWKRDFKRTLEDYWENRFYLVPPESCKIFDSRTGPGFLSCRLHVELVPTVAGAHYVFNVVRYTEFKTNRAMTGGPGFTGWLGDVGRGSDKDSDTELLDLANVGHIFALPLQSREFAGLNRYFRLQSPVFATIRLNETGAAETQSVQAGHSHRSLNRHARPWQLAIEGLTHIKADSWDIWTVEPDPRSLAVYRSSRLRN